MLTRIHFNPHHLSFLLGVSLFILIIFTSIFALCQWSSDWKLNHQILPTISVKKSDQTTTLINSIPQAHLFGQAFTKMGNMPISNLQLRVTGIVKIVDEKNAAFSKAYISIAGQASKIYQAGDALPDGVKIYAIASDAIILENDGHLEKLPLPRQSLEFKAKNDIEES